MISAVMRFYLSTIANSWYREEMSGKRSLLESEQQANICDRLRREKQRHRILILLKQQNLCPETFVRSLFN
ncbi:hypothetical protein [Nostoc favosum]|uniref:Uncharacterized protein n=1 Tax=Nostoc favosum CHAB5714 TaxID=2780399 RepID=A0ABS8IEZ7_9NOSO|nr:hypothetical protein [Nostoc favosum]MCC5602757.1 hypothetical protein [Nostoc favosum CHAB5714]